VTIDDLREAAFAKCINMETTEPVEFDFAVDGKEKYCPRSDTTFREMLKSLAAKKAYKLTVYMKTRTYISFCFNAIIFFF
jgi:hypothetical protein